MNMASISVVISTYNRPEYLKRCLSSVRWADEIIIVDSSETTETEIIANKFTKKIYKQPNNPMLNVNKNFGFTKATRDWILSLDDDEEVTPELAKEIREKALSSELRAQSFQIVGYWIPRKNIIFGKWIEHGIWWPDPQLRLFRQGSGKFPGVHVHEYIEVSGKTDQLTQPMVHYNYDSVSQFIYKMDAFYTESEVQKHLSAVWQLDWRDAIRFPVSDFVKLYFAQQGYKDGLHGLVLAILQAFYSFVVFAKLWERVKFREVAPYGDKVNAELNRAGGEISYWMLSSRIRQERNLLKKFFLKLQRRYGTKV